MNNFIAIEKLEADKEKAIAELSIDIHEMWDFKYDKGNLYLSWIEMVSREFKKNRYLSFIDIKKHLINNDTAK